MLRETKIITKYWGDINPLKIEDYLEVGGYQALKKYISSMKSEEVIEEIKKSGLCGRGGAGFPTGDKLKLVADNKSEEKYFICNLDESEPGTYKDRAIVDNNPHSLLEGIIIAALAVGAKKAFIYINGNYEKQKEILILALEQTLKKNFWGEKMLNSKYNLEIEIFSGAGAYICGEETALINSMEGNRGEPKNRPPYPTEIGYLGKPTAIDNAETLVNIPWIINNGAAKYLKIGLPFCPGTKLYILGGAVRNLGVVEAPTGITIKKLIEKYGGGVSRGKEFWFAQIGGASGKIAVKKEINTKLGYKPPFFPVGSGAVLVVDKTVNIYDLLLSWTGFFRRESCGKCVPCREGTFRLHEIAQRMQDGEISQRDREAIEDILWTLNNTTFCPLGKFAATAFGEAMEKLNM